MDPVIQNLSPSDTETLLQALKRKHPTLHVKSMSGTPALEKAENFMSMVTRVGVSGHDLDTGDKVTLSLIMKRPPESAERRELFLCDAAFHNEATFYSEVAPRLGDVVKLPFPPCLTATNDVIVLRDLRQDGFTMVDRRAGLDLDHCLLALKELGRYHAFSFAMKHLHKVEFDKLASSVKEVFIHKGNTILIGSIDHCITMAVKASTNSDTDVIKRLKGFLGKGIDVLTPHVVPKEPLAVICHGDFHSNNILFRYTNNNNNHNQPTDAAFIDLQGCRYASPALDILYFIFSSGSSDVLKHSFEALLSTYQYTLKNQLKNLAPSARVPSLDEIMSEVKLRLDYGLVMSLLMLPLVSAESMTFDLDKVSHETLTQVQKEVESNMINDQYRNRVNDLFRLISREKLLCSC